MEEPDRYAVVGHPIAHSRSPVIHAAFAAQSGQHLIYERLLAPLDGFVATVRAFRAGGGKGLNVTQPFKLEAYSLARERSERAELAEAVNTLAWRGDHWYGDNTDGAGLVSDLTHNLHMAAEGRRVLILGAGGAVHGILGPLLRERPARVAIWNRTHDKAQSLAHHFAGRGAVEAVTLDEATHARFDIVINATSVALESGRRPAWPPGVFAPGALAYDMVYGQASELFLGWAKEQDAERAVDGLGMLVEQAAESFFLWRGVRPLTAPVIAELRRK